MRTIWTQEQIAFLKNNYELMKTKELLSVLSDKTNDQLRWKAADLGIKKKVTKAKTDMTWLENLDDIEACYWWGFITADGCINDRSLIIAVHERDKDHLKLFCNKCNSKISKSVRREDSWHPKPYTMVRTAIYDKYTLPKLKTRLKIKPQKTYNPCQQN